MNMRRIFSLLMVLTLVILAGCGAVKQSDEAVQTSGSPGPQSAAVGSKEPVVIGAIIGLSGRLEHLGKADRAAMEIVADQINSSGGALGHPVKLVFYDELAESADVLKQAERDNVFAYVGFESSDNALKFYPEIMKQKKILMVTGAGSPALTDAVAKDPVTNKYLFRNGAHARDWARTAAVFMRDIQKAKTYFYLSQEAPFGHSLETVLADLVKNDGITSVGSHYFPREATEFTEVLKMIEAAKPDVIISYIGVSGPAFATLYNDQKFSVPLFDIAANSFELEEKVKENLGNKADHIALTLFAADVPITSKTKAFYAAYRSKMGANPGGLFDIRAGDSISILAEAIAQAGGPDTYKVIDVLERRSFTGVAGIYEFDSSHQAMWGPSHLSGLIGQWQKGNLEVVWPNQAKTASYSPAPWWSAQAVSR